MGSYFLILILTIFTKNAISLNYDVTTEKEWSSNGELFGGITHSTYQNNASSLPYDTCQVIFLSMINETTVGVWMIPESCYHCVFQQLLPDLPPNEPVPVNLSTTFPLRFEIREMMHPSNWSVVLNFTYWFDEHGIYTVVIQKSENHTYVQHMSVDSNPTNAFIPILISFFVFVGLAIVFIAGNLIVRKIMQEQAKSSQKRASLHASANAVAINVGDKSEKGGSNKPMKGGRVDSLDTFRGICLMVMIFVNYGGGYYWFFNHSYWNGLTVADLVFPWFIFIMGIAIPLSFAGLEKRGTSKYEIFYKILRRSVILFGLGLLVNNCFDLDNCRIPGVLQRFGVTYFFTSLIVSFIPATKSRPKEKEDYEPLLEQKPNQLDDFRPYLLQWLFALLLPFIWLTITFAMDVPGCGAGYLGPGGIGDYGLFQNCTGGAAGYIDKITLGMHHIYHGPTCLEPYQCGAYDPEGILGCLTSIFLCWLGVQTGRVLLVHKRHITRITRWTVLGIVWGVIGLILCEAKQNGGWIPINKNMWSLSFILVMAGTGNLFLVICYIFVDVLKIWNGAPFIYPGMNSIMIYTGSELLEKIFPFSFKLVDPVQHSWKLFSNLIGVSCWVAVAFYAYVCKFFVNI